MSDDVIKKSKTSTNINGKIRGGEEDEALPVSPPFATRHLDANSSPRHHEVQITGLASTPGKENKVPMWSSASPNKNPPPLPIAPNMKDMLNKTPSKTRKLISRLELGGDEREIVIDTSQIQAMLDKHLKDNKLSELKELLESLIARSKNNNSSLVDLAANVKEFNENLDSQREMADKIAYIYNDIVVCGTTRLEQKTEDAKSGLESAIEQLRHTREAAGENPQVGTALEEISRTLSELVEKMAEPDLSFIEKKLESLKHVDFSSLESKLETIKPVDLSGIESKLEVLAKPDLSSIESKLAAIADVGPDLSSIKSKLDLIRGSKTDLSSIESRLDGIKPIDLSAVESKLEALSKPDLSLLESKLDAIKTVDLSGVESKLAFLSSIDSKLDEIALSKPDLSPIESRLDALSRPDLSSIESKLDTLKPVDLSTIESKLEAIAQGVSQSNSQLVTRNEELTREITKLKLQLDSQKQFEDLQKDRDALLTSIGILVERHKSYKTQIDDLKQAKLELLNDIEAIKKNAKQELAEVGIDSFGAKINSLKRQHQEIEVEKKNGSKKRNFTSVLS